MKLTLNEIKSVSLLEPQKRYNYFIKKVADSEIMYSLKDKEGRWATSEVEGKKLFSLWTAKEYAANCIIGEWDNYKPYKITLDEFQNQIIDYLEENDFLLNIFSIKSNSGFVVSLSEFVQDLTDELNKY